MEVIEIASRAGKYDDLIRYLQMARKTIREPQVDGYLLLSFAKTDRLHDLEDFLAGLNVADVFPLSDPADNRSLILVRNATTRNCTKLQRSSSPPSPTGLDWHLRWSTLANSRMPLTVHAKPTPQSQLLP
jgi:hypothetical protein